MQLLAAYEKAHGDGLLSAALEPLRKQAERVVDSENRRREEEAKIARQIGSAAPDFTLQDLEGNEKSLSDYRGKVVLLAFWGYG